MRSNHIPFSYPTLLEAIRFLLVSYDLKGNNKRIDDKSDAHIDSREIDHLIQEMFVNRIHKAISLTASEFIGKQIKQLRNSYIDLVKNYSADGLTRAQTLNILNEWVFPYWASKVFSDLKEQFGGPSTATLFVEHNLAVPLVLEWASKNCEDWNQLLNTREKQERDTVAQWRRGKDLPSMYGISLIKNWHEESEVQVKNIENIQLLLLMARAIDYWRKTDPKHTFLNTALLQIWQGFPDPYESFQREINSLQAKASSQYSDSLHKIAKLQHELSPHELKNASTQAETRELLDSVRQEFTKQDLVPGMQYWLDWYEAKWHVYSGDLELANQFYKKAFDAALYQGGINVQDIIDQASIVAACLAKPDQVFLKHLKWASVLFKYDIPSVTTPELSNRFSDNIESWEIDAKKYNFHRFFPKAGHFPDVEFEEDMTTDTCFPSKEEVKPDYRNPNRKIKVSDGNPIRMPQLNWFIMEENFEVFCTLLDKEADPNVYSESKDTPLQLSLRMLSTRTPSNSSFDDRYFWKLAERNHKKEIVNLRSETERSLPLILAVESGNFDIVKKLLDMGANPNQRGHTDEQTALNVCLKLINVCKKPESYIREQLNHPETTELFDSYRRNSDGMTGATLEQNKQFHEQLKDNPLAQTAKEIMLVKLTENLKNRLDLESLRQIAATLILSGSDVNAKHNSPVKGYTPLMLAAEDNEDLLFQLMLEKGGNPKESYSYMGREIDCWEISENFGSTEVQTILRKTQLH